jgi:predicted ester cyclase
MSTEANKALIQRFFEEVFNRGNLEAIDELWIAGAEESGKRAVLNLRTAFPDYHRTIEQQIADGDTVVTRWTMRGTHRGPFISQALGRVIASTGRSMTVPGVSIHRVVDGRLVEAWVSGNDSLELLQQLGAIAPA